MRLIETTELTFKEFHDTRQLPDYAILSHCWSENAEDEVSYQAFLSGEYNDISSGWLKIRECCRIALEHGIKWVWVDTCCINKESSAELSEAINSMFRWYQLAKECYVFLPDVHLEWTTPAQPLVQGGGDNNALLMQSVRVSKWFSRGWTLQELLAPSQVEFFNTQYRPIGTRQNLGLHIERITGVEVKYLLKPERIMEASVAKRMFWAAKRETGREEDIAYSLLGIFGVNMPLIYGEGHRAFFRLQTAIIETIDDESIFAWGFGDLRFRGVLAFNPGDFATSKDIVRIPRRHSTDPFRLTNRGIQYHYKFIRRDGPAQRDIALNCKDGPSGDRVYLSIVYDVVDRDGNRAGLYVGPEPGRLEYELSFFSGSSQIYLSVTSNVLENDVRISEVNESRKRGNREATMLARCFTSMSIFILDIYLTVAKTKAGLLFIVTSLHVAIQLVPPGMRAWWTLGFVLGAAILLVTLTWGFQNENDDPRIYGLWDGSHRHTTVRDLTGNRVDHEFR